MQGDVIAIVDEDAETVANYSYDAWGVPTIVQDTVGIAQINPFRYRGYYYDEEVSIFMDTLFFTFILQKLAKYSRSFQITIEKTTFFAII